MMIWRFSKESMKLNGGVIWNGKIHPGLVGWRFLGGVHYGHMWLGFSTRLIEILNVKYENLR